MFRSKDKNKSNQVFCHLPLGYFGIVSTAFRHFSFLSIAPVWTEKQKLLFAFGSFRFSTEGDDN